MNTVRPIKDEAKLNEIQTVLGQSYNPHDERMFLLFVVGIHTGLRISDLVRLQKMHVMGKTISTIEKKTGKETSIPLDETVQRILRDRLRGMADDDFLFPSRNRRPDGKLKPISTRCAYADMQLIAQRFNLGKAIGCHTLRKTFGYIHYKRNKDLEMLRQWFNHTSVDVTRRYIGMDEEERRKSMYGHNPGGYQYQLRGDPQKAQKGRGAPLEIERLDREIQGQIWGAKAAARMKKKKAEEEKSNG